MWERGSPRIHGWGWSNTIRPLPNCSPKRSGGSTSRAPLSSHPTISCWHLLLSQKQGTAGCGVGPPGHRARQRRVEMNREASQHVPPAGMKLLGDSCVSYCLSPRSPLVSGAQVFNNIWWRNEWCMTWKKRHIERIPQNVWCKPPTPSLLWNLTQFILAHNVFMRRDILRGRYSRKTWM